MPLQLITAPTTLPVTLAEARLHLRLSPDQVAEDAMIESLIEAATLGAEHLMGRAIMPQTWRLSLDAFAVRIPLEMATVTAVDVVKYVNASGILTTMADTDYQLANASDYSAALVPAYGRSWPEARNQPEAVQITFTAGYADADSVPEPIKSWIKLLVGAMFVNRESEVIERGAALTLGFADRLLDRYRTFA